jgi:cholesterol transport system auxiliary component
LTACTLPHPANTPVVYDFGPGALQTAPSTRIAHLPPLEFSTPQTSTALNSTAVLYRLAYTDAQQLKPYTMARWSMPPAQLIGQRLRSQMGQHRAIVSPGDISPPRRTSATASAPVAATPDATSEPLLNLHLELDEFSQLFDAPDKSSGVLRLRATVTQRGTALTAATDQAILEIDVWLAQVGRAGK